MTCERRLYYSVYINKTPVHGGPNFPTKNSQLRVRERVYTIRFGNRKMKSKGKGKRSRTDMESENPNSDANAAALINSFIEITSSTQQEALFFLESHNFDLDAAVSTFLDNDNAAIPNIPINDNTGNTVSPNDSLSPDFQPSESPSRSQSPPPTRVLRSRRSLGKKASGSRQSGIRILRDVKGDQNGSSSESDEPQEYYAGGQKR